MQRSSSWTRLKREAVRRTEEVKVTLRAHNRREGSSAFILVVVALLSAGIRHWLNPTADIFSLHGGGTVGGSSRIFNFTQIRVASHVPSVTAESFTASAKVKKEEDTMMEMLLRSL